MNVKFSPKARQIMDERFGRDTLIALATADAITPELEHRKSGYVERKRRPYQGNVVRIA